MSKSKTIVALSLSVLAAACAPQIGGDQPAGGPDAGSAPDPVNPVVCDEAVSITFEQRQVVPDIMLVLDKSGSMGDPLISNNSTSKWDVMRTAVAGLVANKGDKVNFGLMMFPWTNDCNTGQVRVAPQINNVGSILQEMNSTSPSGKTPTHQSLARARDFYDAQPVNPDGRIVVLATDGLPVCSSVGQSVDVINSLLQRDIKTYVLGFGFGDVDINGLQSMATAGGTGQVYSADSPTQLNVALDTILGEVTVPTCDFALQETPANDEDINVTVNGVELGRDSPNGWSYDASTNTITLQGAACDAVKQGGASGIEVDLGCEGTVID